MPRPTPRSSTALLPQCPPRSTRGCEVKRLLIGLLTVVSLTACGGAVTEPLSSAASTQSEVYAPAAAPVPAATPPVTADPTKPTRLRLDGINAPVVPLDLSGSTLVPPDDPTVLGWWGK